MPPSHGQAAKPFTRFRLINDPAGTPIVWAKYYGFGGRNCTGPNPYNPVLVDPATAPTPPPVLPNPIQPILSPTQTVEDDKSLSPQLIQSIRFEMQVASGGVRYLPIQHSPKNYLREVEILFLNWNGTQYCAEITLTWTPLLGADDDPPVVDQPYFVAF